MRVLILVTLVALVSARPEAPLSYQGLLHLPSGQNGSPETVYVDQTLVNQQLPDNHILTNFAPIPSYVPPASSLSSPADESLSNALHADTYSTAHLLSSLPQEASATSAGYPYAPQQATVHKHIYVHVPPKEFEEEDAVQLRVHQPVGPKQKHYKIVFIKTPAAPAIHAPIVPPPPQSEEKTLIYVLHKKPESAEDVVIPAPAPTQPSKPEVYFIKYKTRKEEAPVYGPPAAAAAALETQPRDGLAAGGDIGLSLASAPAPSAVESGPKSEPAAPLTTLQSAKEEIPEEFVKELPAEAYGVPTAVAALPNQVSEGTLTAPSSQFLGAQPIVAAEEQNLPAAVYGSPSNSFLKKKK